jgi:hypothetical protein
MSKKINDYEIVCPRVGSGKKEWKGMDLFDIQYWVMACLGKRRSGKTSLIYTLIKAFTTKNYKFIFFVPTFWKDDSYEVIRNFLDKKKIPYQDFQSIEEDGVNNLDVVMKVLEEKASEDEEEEGKEEEENNKEVKGGACFGPPTAKDKEKVGKEVEKDKDKDKDKIENEWFIIFDDISTEIRNKAVLKLCKNSRHYKAKIILSTQSITDLHPHIFNQLDYVAVFKNFNLDALKQLYERIDPNISYEQFVNIYREITDKVDRRGHSPFMLIDRPNNKIRENLNILIE